MIGKHISRYVISEKIGEGGMGSVWRAEDPLLGRDIALKFLPDSHAGSPEARKRFLREAKAASTLHHPGIATVFDAGEADERIYIAFLLVDGETVAERLKDGPLSLPEACRVAIDAAEALDHAHERGVLHRDVTSRNIMIDGQGRVIVVDFGLALPQGATRVTQSGMAVGTAPYLSPEVITGKEGDARADVYGLGVVLYEALAGGLPFDADRAESLFYLIVHTAPEPPSARREAVPAELDRIVMKALAKDPSERYASAREFAKDLYSFLEKTGEHPPPARWLTGTRPADGTAELGDRSASSNEVTMTTRIRGMVTKPVAALAAVVFTMALAITLWRFGIFDLDRRMGVTPAFASVAVLPFQNLSDTPGEDAWLAEGIAEALTAKLTSVSGVRVTPWLTSRNFGDLSRPLGEVAKELNVETLVVGTVRQLGEQVLCTISVVDAKTESQWWADEYEEPMNDLFGVQRRIALGVATSLKGRLSGDEERDLGQPAARSVEAYEHYLRGSVVMQAGTPEGINDALPFFERARELDPEFADAYVGLGAVHSNRFFIGWGDRDDLREAEEMFRRALELDPTSIAARRGLARVYWEFGRSEDALREGREAHRINPSGVENLLAIGEAYYFGGLPEKAIPILKRAIELDPANEAAHWFLTLAYVFAGQFDDAIEFAERYVRKFGEDPEVYLWVGVSYHALGDFDVAEIYYDRSLTLIRDASDEYAWQYAISLYFDTGEERKARAGIAEALASTERKLGAYPDQFILRSYLAALYALKGDMPGFQTEFDNLSDKENWATIYVAAAIAQSGDNSSAAAILENAVRKGWNLKSDFTASAVLFPDGFLEHPAVQPALRAMNRLHDELAARY